MSARDPGAALRELAERLEEAERASDRKTAFIGHVAHEFRTPLSSILGFASILLEQETELPEERRRAYLEIILRNARHLQHVAMDILNLSKVEAGTLEVTLAPMDAAQAASAAIHSLQPQAAAREITLRLDAVEPAPVLADEGRLRQVLLNLLENAIKYSPPGSTVAVSARADADGARIEVRDRGPGISDRDQDRLFVEFSRINPGGRRVAGAGLGLALSKRMVELMDGEIGVVSTPGEGSTFWVALPGVASGAPRRRAAAPAPEPAGGGGAVVAVVDDEPDIRAYASAVLEHSGYRVVVDDGAPGVAERLAANPPGAILLDLDLGGRTGTEVLRELRALPELAGVPALVFSASTTRGEWAECEAAGFQGMVEKPVEPGALMEAVGALFPPAPAPAAEPDDYLAPLRERFRAGLPGRLATLEERRARGDAEGFAREAHKLKGAAAGYGFAVLSEAAAAAEEASRGPAGDLSHPAVEALVVHLRAAPGAAP